MQALQPLHHRVLLACALLILLLAAPAAAQNPTPPVPKPPPPAAQDPITPPKIKGKVTLTQTFEVVQNTPTPPKKDDVAKAEGKKQEATVGSPWLLTLQVTRPRDTSLTLPADQNTGRFELLHVDRQIAPVAPDAKEITETIKMTFAVYRPGRHILEPFSLSILDADGGISKISTKPVEIKIRSVIANEKDPQMLPPRAPVSVWIEDWTLTWFAGTILALLLAAGLGALLYRSLRPEPPPPPGPPPRPAHEIAREKLRALRKADLINEGLYEDFYVRLSGILREYLGRRYNLSLADTAGLELTTQELIALMHGVHWPRNFDKNLVETFLYDCDIVKFARYTPTQEEAQILLDQAVHIVDKTHATVLGSQVLASKTETEDDKDSPKEPVKETPKPEEDEDA